MSESTLKIPTPKDCLHCQLSIRDEYRDYFCTGGREILTDKYSDYKSMRIPKWCPLKEG